MEKDPLVQKLVDLYSRDDLDGLAGALRNGLDLQRERTLSSIEKLVGRYDGKLQLTVFELLMKDGGDDLIPLFIEAIRTEKNTLYGKSLILLFKEFRHQRALGALLSIETSIDKELKSTYQRVLGQLLSQFSEQFYMSEFQAGLGDPRRVQFAADMMLRSPHPAFLPFLAERVQENDMGFRQQGLRVLRELGNLESNEALFSMLDRLGRQLGSAEALVRLLAQAREPLFEFFERLVQGAGLNWDSAQIQAQFRLFPNGEVEALLAQILDGYAVFGEVRSKIKPYLKGILCGGEPSTFQTSRARAAVDEYRDQLVSLRKEAVYTMGAIAVRVGDDQFLDRIEAQLANLRDGHDALLISSLAGFRSAKARALLVEYVNTCTEPEILEQALDALSGQEMSEVPRGVEKLCFDEDNGLLRRRAIQLVARWGQGPALAERLLDSKAMAVCADGLRMISEYRLEEAYSMLLAMLQKDLAESLLANVLDALAAFPRLATGRAVRPFMLPPYTFAVRLAALQTCFKAGGEDRHEWILRTLSQVPPGKGQDLLDVYLNLVLTDDWEDRESFLIQERDFWLRQLVPEQENLWPKLAQLIESLPLRGSLHARGWLSALRRALGSLVQNDPGPELRRLVALADSLAEELHRQNQFENESRQIHGMIEAIRDANPYQRTQAMRQLARNFPEGMAAHDKAVRSLCGLLEEELTRKEPVKDTLIQAITLAGKLRHPSLRVRLELLRDYGNIDVRAAVGQALESGLDPVYQQQVRSVFIMDDSRYITKQLAKVLAREGFDVDFENDPQQGLDRLSRRRFDLLVLDVLMPNLSGAEFLTEARKRGLAPRYTLVITSSRDREEISPILAVGVDGMLLKPFRMEDLLNRIAEVSG